MLVQIPFKKQLGPIDPLGLIASRGRYVHHSAKHVDAKKHEKQNVVRPGLEVIKLEYSLRLKIKRNDWLLTCPQAANQCALF